MKVLILGAGYGTRLTRDLQTDSTGQYSSLIDIPKPLLPIGDLPLVSHWMKQIEKCAIIDTTYIVTNDSNQTSFKAWAEDWPEVKLVSDGTKTNESRIGAVACINLAVQHFNINDHLLVIAGDTLFYEDFHLENIISEFLTLQNNIPGACLVTDVECRDDEVHKYGILETDSENRVIGFKEKPQPSETKSRKQCPCFYLLSQDSLPLLNSFLEEKKNEPLKSRDATGNFIAYIYTRLALFTHRVSGRFDVGGLQTYITCHEYFLNKLKTY